MRKLTWFGSILLTLIFCAASVSHAQKVRYEYAGPLDGLQAAPVSNVVTPEPAHRVASLKPAKKLPPAHPSVSRAMVGRITGASTFSPARQSGSQAARPTFASPRPTRAIRQVLPETIQSPAFSGPLTESTGQVLRRNESTQHGYSGALTDPRSRPAEANHILERSDSAQFGSSRALTNPKSRPADTVYVRRQEDSFQQGHPRAHTNSRNYQVETNYVPAQNVPEQFVSSRSFTNPRVTPVESNHALARNTQEQFGSSSRSFTNPRVAPIEPNYLPAQNAPEQLGSSSRSFTNPRGAPVEPDYIPAQNESAQHGYSEAITDHGNYPAETNYAPAQDDSTEPSYAGAFTNSGGYQTEARYIPRREDPTRFGYRDGTAFGFDNTRLFNPREGPQLDLQGAPTVAFGEPGCDEWADFGLGRDLEFDAPCGGMKAKPGHLGIPWLGSKENCDQRVPLRKNRRLGGRRDQAEDVCETCGSCPTCGR